MADHDQRLKTLVREFFEDFIGLAVREWAERFDFSAVEWLEQEVFPDPPRGQRRAVDLVARVATRQPLPSPRHGAGDSWLTLIHVEVESADTVAPLRRRIFEYRNHLEHKHGLPVLPIGLYLRVGLDGIGWDTYEVRYWERSWPAWNTLTSASLPWTRSSTCRDQTGSRWLSRP